MCYKTILFAALVFSVFSDITAQNIRYFSLDEAVKLSLENGKQLKFNQAKIDEAKAVLKHMQNNLLPDVKASGGYLRLTTPDLNLKSEQLKANNQNGALFNVKINQVAYGLAVASLPLFSGFNIRYGIESAKYLAEAEKLGADNDREAFILNTISAYSNLYKAGAEVELVRQNLKQSQARVEDFVIKEENGIIIRNDLLKVQLQESNMELSLFQAEADLNLAIVNMNLLIGLPENSEWLPDTNWLVHLSDNRSFEEWKQSALQNRKDIAALEFRERSAYINIKSAKAEYYPGIALTGNYIAADISNLLTVTDLAALGVGLKYNFGSLWKTNAKVAQAKAKHQQLLMNKGILNDQISLEINEAYQAYILGLKKIEVYAKALEQARENYQVTQIQFDNQVVTTTDLLDADLTQLQAKLNYAFSKADAIVAYKKLLQTAGLLGDHISGSDK